MIYICTRCIIQDARSVSIYPYNWSQILQYVKFTNIYIAKGIAKVHVNILFLFKYKK